MALNSNFRTLTADNIEGVSANRNYLKSSFENGQITGWTEVSVALTSGLPTGTPTISSTAASSLALSATSVTPLSGSRSLLVDVPSALTAGHGFISDEFTIDRMDLGKVLTVTFDYERLTGTYNFSGTLGSQTWMVYIYDATLGAANWIQPAGYLGINQSSGPGRVACTFQTSVTAGQKYRVAVIASQAASGASSIEFDNLTCSRQTAPIGPVVTDWVSYTPTGTWTTNTTYTGRWRRVGDTVEVDVGLALTGAPNATTLYVNYLPPGISIDTSKMSLAQQYIRSGYADGTQGGSAYNLKAIYDSPTRVLLAYQNQLNAIEIVVNATAPITWASGSTIHMRLSLPVAGWSSQVQLSNDTDTRVVAASYSFGNTGLTSTAAIAGIWGQVYDTHGAFTNANGRYTVPVSGYYRVSVLSARTSGTGNSVGLYRDGVFYQTLFAYSIAVGRCSGGISLYCNAGQYLTFGVDGSFTADMIFSIERLSGPSVVAASETVSFSANTSTTAGSTTQCFIYTVKDHDTHNAYSTITGKFTVPVSGKYAFGGYAYFNAVVGCLVLYKNGSVISQGIESKGNAYPSFVSAQLNLVAGDVIELRPTSSVTAGGQSTVNSFYGNRIGQ